MTTSKDPVTTSLLALMIVGGLVCRVWNIAEPRFFTFDEKEFVTNAHNYLVGLRDANDHPPLGKLVMSLGLLLFGNNSLGWRFVPLCFGIENLIIAYFLARALFQSPRAGLFAAAFMAADGFFISYSRAGLLDGILTCLVLLSLLAAVTARGAFGVLLSALLVGLAMSVKWSGAFAAIPALAAVWWLGRAPRLNVLWFLLVPFVHVGVWTLGLYICQQPSDPASLFTLMKSLYQHHLALGKNINAAASPWYSWLVMYHPIVLKLSQHGADTRYASSAGNPWLWYPATLVAIGLPVATLLGFAWRRARRWFETIDRDTLRAGLLLVLAWFSMFSPWIVARGKYTFQYHYLPSYGFALILLAGAAAVLERRRSFAVNAFTSMAFAVAVFYAPVWAEFPLAEHAANARLVFPSWRP